MSESKNARKGIKTCNAGAWNPHFWSESKNARKGIKTDKCHLDFGWSPAYSQNQKMPVRALRQYCVHGFSPPRIISQNQKMPVRALRHPYTYSLISNLLSLSESKNARKGIKTKTPSACDRLANPHKCQNQKMPVRALRPDFPPVKSRQVEEIVRIKKCP